LNPEIKPLQHPIERIGLFKILWWSGLKNGKYTIEMINFHEIKCYSFGNGGYMHIPTIIHESEDPEIDSEEYVMLHIPYYAFYNAYSCLPTKFKKPLQKNVSQFSNVIFTFTKHNRKEMKIENIYPIDNTTEKRDMAVRLNAIDSYPIQEKLP